MRMPLLSGPKTIGGLAMTIVLSATHRAPETFGLVYLYACAQFFMTQNATIRAMLHSRGRVDGVSILAVATKVIWAGGILLAIVHTTEPGEKPSSHRLLPGKLKSYFRGWQILHYYEGSPLDAAHKRRVAEIIARKPRTMPQSR